jgi:hypothetical protein
VKKSGLGGLSSRAAGGLKPQRGEMPKDGEGTQDARFVLKPGFSWFLLT